MDRIDITLSLPQDLVERAKSAGLLTDGQVERWLLDELDRQNKVNQLFSAIDQLSALEPPVTQEEIDAEIEAYRTEKRDRKTGEDS